MNNKVLFEPTEMWEYIQQNEAVIIDTRDPNSYEEGISQTRLMPMISSHIYQPPPPKA